MNFLWCGGLVRHNTWLNTQTSHCNSITFFPRKVPRTTHDSKEGYRLLPQHSYNKRSRKCKICLISIRVTDIVVFYQKSLFLNEIILFLGFVDKWLSPCPSRSTKKSPHSPSNVQSETQRTTSWDHVSNTWWVSRVSKRHQSFAS